MFGVDVGVYCGVWRVLLAGGLDLLICLGLVALLCVGLIVAIAVSV